jgi:hypothetical protein
MSSSSSKPARPSQALGSAEITSLLPFARDMGIVRDAALARIVKHDRCLPRTVASVLPS